MILSFLHVINNYHQHTAVKSSVQHESFHMFECIVEYSVKVKEAILVVYHSTKCIGEWTSQGTVLTQALEVSNHFDVMVHLCEKDRSAIWAEEWMGLRHSGSGGEDKT